MNKNITKYVIIAILAFVPVAVFAQPTPAPSPVLSTSRSSTSAAPSTNSSYVLAPPSVSESRVSAPPSTNSSSVSAPPSTGDSNVSAPASTPTPTPVVVPVTPVTPSSSGSSSGSSGSYSSGGRAFIPVCSFITSYMKYGASNDSAQVTKLQTLLKNTEKLDVDINGIFDQKTVMAVKAFQTKYAGVILAPWGMTEASGNVYLTTMKKVNSIACNQPLTLNPSELAMINSGKVLGNGNVAGNEIGKTTPATTPVVTDATKTDDKSAVVTVSNENQTANVASAAKPSVFKRFWNFVVYLFR